jgi:hypothetical protein
MLGLLVIFGYQEVEDRLEDKTRNRQLTTP